jgi:hypothetical protein
LNLWKLSGGLCPKLLIPTLPALLESLERHKEVSFPEGTRERLLTMSISTAERLLGRLRRQLEHGISTTKAGTLLRQQIPLHTFSDWKDAQPGFMEIDLVAHCGDTAAGQFVYTLTATDVATGWTECEAIANRGQLAVLAGLEAIRERLPFALLGVDSDNGTEFINFSLVHFCKENGITFTRGRPYKKNDQCHVEQKNGAVVRPLVGYARYEGAEAAAYLNQLYNIHRLHLNFFRPSMKLVDKQRNGAKVTKKYDTPKTPLSRLLDYGIVSSENTIVLENKYNTLNPAMLLRRVEEIEAGLRKHAVNTPTVAPIQTHKPRLPENIYGKKNK